MDTFKLYTPLTVALSELKRRRNDTLLRIRIEDYFRDYPSLPELKEAPRIVFSPTLLTPNLETEYFIDMVADLPYQPVIYEYISDKFVHINPQKFNLGQMTFFHKSIAGSKKEIIKSVRVVDFERYQGKPLAEVQTVFGESLIEFHHRLFRAYFSNKWYELHDFSTWFRNSSHFDLQHSYLRFLGLFLTDAILFGHFNTTKSEIQFTHSKVLPAFKKLKEIFGIAPLIVPLQALETENDSFWCYYSDKVLDFLP